MLNTRLISFETKGLGPNIAWVMRVVSPSRTRLNSTMLCASKGAVKSSLSSSFEGGVVSTISMLPEPTSLLPAHA